MPTLVLPEGECPIPGTGQVSAQELERLVEFASQWSLHAVLEQLRRGYLTLEGGHRLGLCGSAVMEGEQIHALRDISGADLRVARQISGIARGFAGKLFQASKLCDTLILAPPGAGKTTLLRDLIRCISSGEAGAPLRVSVADERGELAAMWRGQAQMELGCRTDVMDGCPKAVAIPLLLRGMNPQVIAVDEITALEDIRAIEQAVGCGVALLATAHARGLQDLRDRPLYRKMMEQRLFQQLVIIRVEQGVRSFQVVPAEDVR